MQALARGCRHGEIVPIPQAPDGAISALLQLFEAAPPRKAGEFFRPSSWRAEPLEQLLLEGSYRRRKKRLPQCSVSVIRMSAYHALLRPSVSSTWRSRSPMSMVDE